MLEKEEQLKNWTDEAGGVLVDLYVNKADNDRLVSENSRLTVENRQLKNEADEFKKILSQKDFVAQEIKRLTPINQQLERRNHELNETVLIGEKTVNLKSWVSQRDTILADISDKRIEYDKLNEINKNLAVSNTEIDQKITFKKGQHEELEKKQKEFAVLVPNEIAALYIEKSVLQEQISGYKREIELLKDTKNTLNESIGVLSVFYGKVFDRANGVESLISGIVQVSSDNATKINNILNDAAKELQKVIDLGEKNVTRTNQVILDLPKMVVDLHRDVIERRRINKNRTIQPQ